MCKHETGINRLIGYLIFISVNWNLETTDRLTGYSVKVHSTNIPMLGESTPCPNMGITLLRYVKTIHPMHKYINIIM